jgi:hypothetical protein
MEKVLELGKESKLEKLMGSRLGNSSVSRGWMKGPQLEIEKGVLKEQKTAQHLGTELDKLMDDEKV